MVSQPTGNRLIHETSPYLRQHAQNPVDWFAWGPEALEKAKQEDKPVFLSIGYSACHWCHVMARESFADEAIARQMNERFINIKVDREERPDIDALYMKALVELTGQGGWPLSLFLTPEQEPYFGGTYFPPTPKYRRPGFPQVLQEAYDLYKNRKEELFRRKQRILEKIRNSGTGSGEGDLPGGALIDQAVQQLAERFDGDQGGFGQGMKFPEPMTYSLLLRHWLRTGSDESIHMVDKSLTRMAEGGIYDHLGGGFHRYSTDKNWRVPHFEKMLYDNALLARLFLETFQATKQEIYKTVAQETFEYVRREMTAPEGAFYSSQDADSGGREGAFYAWSLKEVLDLLGSRNAKVLARAYGLTPRGQFEGGNVLQVRDSVERISEEENIPIFEVPHLLKKAKKILFDAREKREKPARDEKIITAWNGLMITALATGYCVLRDPSCLDTARRAGEFLWTRQWRDDRLQRIHKDGQSKIDGCLEDYACFLEALLALYEASLDSVWMDRAVQTADRMIEEFWDASEGGFFLTGVSQEPLILRLKSAADEAVPSANAIAALALTRLAHGTGNFDYLKKAEKTVRAFQGALERSPAAFKGLLGVVDFLRTPPTEVVFAGPRDDARFEELQRVLYQDFRPNKIVLWRENEETERRLPLAEGRTALQGKPTVYLCQNQTCHPPVQSGEGLGRLLERPPEIRINIYDAEKHRVEIESQQQQDFLSAMDRIFKQSGLKGKK